MRKYFLLLAGASFLTTAQAQNPPKNAISFGGSFYELTKSEIKPDASEDWRILRLTGEGIQIELTLPENIDSASSTLKSGWYQYNGEKTSLHGAEIFWVINTKTGEKIIRLEKEKLMVKITYYGS